MTWSSAVGPEMPWPVVTASFNPRVNGETRSPASTDEADATAATDGSAAGAPAKPVLPPAKPKHDPPPTQEHTASAKPPPAPKPVVHRSRHEICATLAKAAENNNLPVPFFIRLLFQESKFQPGAVSHAGAQGIAQFMPATAADVGLDNPFDPLQAIPAAARLLRGLIDQFGNLGLAAAAYNAGPRRVNKWLKQQGDLPAETRGYVKTITGQAPESWKAATAAQANAALPRKAPCKAVSARYLVAARAAVPLPPKRPAAARAPVRIARAAKKPPAKRAIAVASAKHHAERRRHTAIQLAARRR